MFINCPNCRALVATDPATDEPPERCPRCAAPLRLGAANLPPVPAADIAVEPPVGDDSVAHIAVADAREPTVVVETAAPAAPRRDIERAAMSVTAPALAAEPAAPSSTVAESVLPAVRPLAALLKSASRDPQPEISPEIVVEAPASDLAEPSQHAEHVEHAVSAMPQAVHDAQEQVAAAGDGADASTIATAPPDSIVSPVSVPAAVSVSDKTAPAAKPAPSFVRASGAAPRAGWISIAAIAALAVALVLQLLLADRAQLAAQAQWRPLISSLCGALGCQVPPWREPDAFALLARDVQPHPGKHGVLRVTATFRNDARWAQPWPQLRLTLSDINGQPVAAREFAPRDYLGAAPAQAELGSGQSASIAMDIVEPDARSVAFDFALR